MLAAILYGKNDLRIEDMPVPGIGMGEMLVRVKAASVCGTDLRMYQNGATLSPLVLCHEFAGVIEKVGGGVQGYAEGQRVTVAPNIGCGICYLCVSGRSHHCPENRAIGVHMDGGFAEYVKIPANAVQYGNVVPIADNVSYEAAASNEALSCVYSAFERYGVNPGETVVIIGAGAIGLMHAKIAYMAGAAKVIMNDLSDSRLKECAVIEPDLVIVRDNLYKCVMDETNAKGADVVITACGAAAAQQASFELAALDGRVNFFGGLPKDKEFVDLNTNIIHYKQLSVTGTTKASHSHYRKTLHYISTGLVDMDQLVTHRFALGDIDKAFANAEAAVGLRQAVVF